MWKLCYWRTMSAFCGLFFGVAAASHAAETVITFDDAKINDKVTGYTNHGVVFAPAHGTTQSRAVAKVMFFPQLKTDKKGILNAMANDPIPLKITFPNGASSVTLAMWGTFTNPALVEAYDQDGKLVDKASIPKIPARSSPSEPEPTFELSVKAPHIAYVCVSGERTGEYVAVQEVRFTPATEPAN